MFFKNKSTESGLAVFPKIQTAEGWKRMMIQKAKDSAKKKSQSDS